MDALYGLPLDEFTAARNELAHELRQGGEPEAAAWVKGLRKPTAPAWLANQVARTQKKQAWALLEAAEQLRTAHERLLAGTGKPEALRAAAEGHNRAVRDLVGRASGLLDRDGKPPSRSSLDKVEETLHAVAVDEEVRAAFAAGRLTRETRASGLAGLGLGPGAEAPARRKPKARRGGDRARARDALTEAKAEHRERRREVGGAERAVERARREAQRAQRQVEVATSALEKARAREADAAGRVAEAERRLERDA